MKKYNYYVIGGQYQAYCYGGANTILGAKRLASRNAEYWDNWQGWHIPSIYSADDVEEYNNFYGPTMCPKDGAVAVACARYLDNGRHVWEV